MILLISICREKLHELEFVKPIEEIAKKSGKVKVIHYSKLKNSEVNSADKIIICGTSLKDNDFLKPGNISKFRWIKSFKKPLLGICGGAHLIGLALGYKLKRKEEIGLKELNLKDEFLGVKGKIQVYHLHQFYALPEVFHKGNVYATLFHPEVRNKILIDNFAHL